MVAANGIYSTDVKLEPYWWEDARPASEPSSPLPREADVVIVGAGYGGLSAALTLGQSGRDVLLLDALKPGEGASSRNGGAVGETLRISFATMARTRGLDAAVAMYGEVQEARRYLESLIQSHEIDCNYQRVGRFIGCHAPKYYAPLARDLEMRQKHLGFDAEMIPQAEQHRVIGSDVFFGGRLIRSDGNLHPAKLVAGLVASARRNGAQIRSGVRVTGITRDSTAFRVAAGDTTVKARNVLVCTNGYTGPEMAWLRPRLIPLQSQIIATAPIPSDVLDRLIPDSRQLGDTCHLHYYFRRSPDGRRILFGGRAGAHVIDDPRRSGQHLYRRMIEVFPELDGTPVTHSWGGFVAYTFDHLPHIREHEGVHYVSGCCGSGVVMQTWLGHKTALRVLGHPDGRSAFDRPYETRPLYTGNPWFIPAMIAYFGVKDRFRL